MSAPILLDVTRMAAWRWHGGPPTGLDRVCDAYTRHFADRARAVVQIAGRARVLDDARSRRLFDAFNGPKDAFRRSYAGLFASLAGRPDALHANGGSIYLNVGHSGFDRASHWRSIDRVGAPRVYLLHDLIPITHPHLTTAHKSARHRGRVRQALSRAEGIVVNSQATADALAAFAQGEGQAMPPVLVAPLGAGPPTLPEGDGPAPEKPFFLCLGTVEPRKNHGLLLRTWSRLIDDLGEDAPQLVIAGKRGLRAAEILAPLGKDRQLPRFVQLRPGLSDAQVAALMADARALLFPTLAEGFGLPLVEALQACVPVIASDLPALREAGQGIATLLDPQDEDSWACMIAGYCGDHPDRQRQLSAMAGYRPATWAEHFSALEEWLAKLPAERLDNREGCVAAGARKGDFEQDRAWHC